jgi:hypothetical protein
MVAACVPFERRLPRIQGRLAETVSVAPAIAKNERMRFPWRKRIRHAALLITATLCVAACGTLPGNAPRQPPPSSGELHKETGGPLGQARAAWRRATATTGTAAIDAWLRCATLAHAAMGAEDRAQARAAAALATRCSEGFLSQALRRRWQEYPFALSYATHRLISVLC